VRSVFDWSYQVLTPAAARLFRLLARHPGPDRSVGAAAGLAGETPAEVRQSFGELQRANLVAETEPGRFPQHDLLRAYARELVRSDDVERLRDYFLHSAAAASRLLFPGREEPPMDPSAAGSVPASFRYAADAAAWFEGSAPDWSPRSKCANPAPGGCPRSSRCSSTASAPG
jgi:hypothetical protein